MSTISISPCESVPKPVICSVVSAISLCQSSRRAVVTGRPDLAGRVVAVDVCALAARESPAVVDDRRPSASGTRSGECSTVGLVSGVGPACGSGRTGGSLRRRSSRSWRPARRGRPSPRGPGRFAHPDVAGLRSTRHPPGIPEAVGPGLRPRVLHADERVVLRDRVGFPRLGMIDVDAQHLGQQRVMSWPTLSCRSRRCRRR